MRVFYVIYVHDEPYKTVLNGIRALANPKEKHSVHITVQGPLTRRHNQAKLEDFNAKILRQKISVMGVDSFFEQSQNTVFLRCESDALPAVWRKPHYDYNPHLTLYDGDCRQFAEEMLAVLLFSPIYFDFYVDSGIEPLVINGQRDFYLAYNINYRLLESYAGCKLNHEIISSLTSAQRLRLIKQLAISLAQEHPVHVAL